MPETTTDQPEVKKEIPNDLFSDKVPDKEILPLEEEPKKRDYTDLPKGATNGQESNGEAKAAPQADGATPASSAAPATSTDSSPAPAKQEVKLTPEEQQTQAKQTVDLMLKGYEKLHVLGRYVGKVDVNELAVLHSQGKIDLDQELPIGSKTISERQFFSEYNEGVQEGISISEEFKQDIRPPLERMCIKHGWYVSDEIYVLTTLGEDIATKVSLLIGLKKSCNLVLEACMEIQKTKTQRNAGNNGNAKEEQKQEGQQANQENQAEETIKTSAADEWREPSQ